MMAFAVATAANSQDDEIAIYLGELRFHFQDQGPVMIDGRVFVPVEVFEYMGYEVVWLCDDESIVQLLNQWDDIIFIAGEAFFELNGLVIYPDIPQQLINGRLMLPLRAIFEASIWGNDPPSDIELARVLAAAAGELPFWDEESRAVLIPGPANHPSAQPWPRQSPPIDTAEIQERLQQIPDSPTTLADLQQLFPHISGKDNLSRPVTGGDLRVGIPHWWGDAFMFNPLFAITPFERAVMEWYGGNTSVFSRTSYNTFGQAGIATWTHDSESRSMTITQVHSAYWHTLHPVTLGDLVFAHEVIASPGYAEAGGLHRATTMNIIGAQAFYEGKADYISGLVLSEDERELTIYFNKLEPSIFDFTIHGLFTIPYPRHIFEGMSIEEQRYHFSIGGNTPIGWGPFVVGLPDAAEGTVSLYHFEHYWQGNPYLERVILRSIERTQALYMMEYGELDVVEVSANDFVRLPNPDNFHYIANIANVIGTVSFNLGYWDPEIQAVIPFENAKMGDVRLRRAMAYAINEYLLTETVFEPLRTPATSIAPPGFIGLLDPNIRGFYYNPERAKAYLDAAGFTVGPDGWRTDPDGNEFIINFLTPDDGDMPLIAEAYAYFWERVGLQVSIEWVDFTFNNHLLFDPWDRDFDVSIIQWLQGNPDPNALWGHTAINTPRFMNNAFELHLEGFNSPKAINTEWLINHHHEWQRLFYEYAPAFPTNWRLALTAVSNRVIGFDVLNEDGPGTRHLIWVVPD